MKPSRTRRWNSTCSPSKRSGPRTSPRARARVRARPVSTGQSSTIVSVGPDTVAGEPVELVEQLQIEAAAIALVGGGRIGVAVGDHDLARCQRRAAAFHARAARGRRAPAAARRQRCSETAGSRKIARIASPARVPPGSWVSVTCRPRARSSSARIAAWVVLPEPSTPSSVMKRPSAISAIDTSLPAAVERARRIRPPPTGRVRTAPRSRAARAPRFPLPHCRAPANRLIPPLARRLVIPPLARRPVIPPLPLRLAYLRRWPLWTPEERQSHACPAAIRARPWEFRTVRSRARQTIPGAHQRTA